MHDGSLATLEAVVDYYAQGGRPNLSLDPIVARIRLSLDEQRALVAFLRTLNGAVVEGT